MKNQIWKIVKFENKNLMVFILVHKNKIRTDKKNGSRSENLLLWMGVTASEFLKANPEQNGKIGKWQSLFSFFSRMRVRKQDE